MNHSCGGSEKKWSTGKCKVKNDFILPFFSLFSIIVLYKIECQLGPKVCDMIKSYITL